MIFSGCCWQLLIFFAAAFGLPSGTWVVACLVVEGASFWRKFWLALLATTRRLAAFG
jgi:hypothetical protein